MTKSKKANKTKTATAQKAKAKKLTKKDLKKVTGGFGIHLPFKMLPQGPRTYENPGQHKSPSPSPKSSPGSGSGANRQKAGR